MIADLKPYPEYKESGLPGIGDIPTHWETLLNRRIFAEEIRPHNDVHETQLSLSQRNGLIATCDMKERSLQTASYDNWKVTLPGDLVLNRFKAHLGVFFASTLRGIVSFHYGVFKPRSRMHTKYFELLFHTYPYRTIFAGRSNGMTVGLQNLSNQNFYGVRAVVPPYEEQDAIVRFLDWATGRLDRAIRAKRKIVALLNEKKQVIIQRVVTRGLDPNVPLKPSGIPWLGEIPAHWEIMRAKYLFREVDDRTTSGNEELLSVSHITGVTPRSQKRVTMFKAASYMGHKMCKKGDLVVNTMWAWMGALGVSEYQGIISPAYAVYRPHSSVEIVGAYMDWLLRSRPYISNIICRSTGLRTSRLRLYPDVFFRLPILQPPVSEQRQIVDAVKSETAEMIETITLHEREIELLREYRTRLIADVVTGKLDVREAAAKLPVEAVAEEVDEIDEEESDVADEEVEP